MSADDAIRGCAALAALVLACAPAAPIVVAWAREHAPKAREALKGWPQFALAGVLAYVAIFGVPQLPALTPTPVIPVVVVQTPSPAMQAAVSDVHKALLGANPVDRAVWAQLWSNAGKVVGGDATETEVVFTDTRALRAFNIIALRIGWRRLGENAQGKYPGLGEATERAFAGVLGTDVQPVTTDIRSRYIELCNALAWCGAGKG